MFLNGLFLFGGPLIHTPYYCFGLGGPFRRIVTYANIIIRSGVPHQPGIVCTVLSDDELAELGLRGGGDAPSVTHGVAYRIPDDQVHSGTSCLRADARTNPSI